MCATKIHSLSTFKFSKFLSEYSKTCSMTPYEHSSSTMFRDVYAAYRVRPHPIGVNRVKIFV